MRFLRRTDRVSQTIQMRSWSELLWKTHQSEVHEIIVVERSESGILILQLRCQIAAICSFRYAQGVHRLILDVYLMGGTAGGSIEEHDLGDYRLFAVTLQELGSAFGRRLSMILVQRMTYSSSWRMMAPSISILMLVLVSLNGIMAWIDCGTFGGIALS
jgi:hypothetical protein